MRYTVSQLLSVIMEDGCDIEKPVIIEVGGVRIPLEHAYVVYQENIDEGAYNPEDLGALVIDLDV